MKRATFHELMSSVRQARWIRRGMVKAARITVFRPKYVKAARARLGRLKSEFALEIRVSVATSQSCEQGRRTPDGPALALLRVAAGNPKPVAEALHVKRRGTAQFA